MPATRVVPADVGHQGEIQVESCRPAVAADQLALERRDHALGHGVVQRGAGAPAAGGEYTRLRFEAARLKALLRQQLFGLFPELLTVWSDVATPGSLAVLRLGLTPSQIAALSRSEFLDRVCASRQGRRLWRAKVLAVYEKAALSVARGDELIPMARETQRLVARYDLLAAQLSELHTEIEALLGQIEEARWLATIPGLAFASVAGIIAHVGPIKRYRSGRQLIKLAGTNPSRNETGERRGGAQAMTHRGRAGLRQVIYMATVSCIVHNERIRARYDRLISRPERPSWQTKNRPRSAEHRGREGACGTTGR